MTKPRVSPLTVLARRTVPLARGRQLEIVGIEAFGTTHVDAWLRLRNANGCIVSQFHVPPGSLRDVARALDSLAGELGVRP